jgi:hypothetical protein
MKRKKRGRNSSNLENMIPWIVLIVVVIVVFMLLARFAVQLAPVPPPPGSAFQCFLFDDNLVSSKFENLGGSQDGSVVFSEVKGLPEDIKKEANSLCIDGCPIGKPGRVLIDCNCATQQLPICVIPEGKGEAICETTCGVWYEADGFYSKGQLYKVSNYACAVVTCFPDGSAGYASCCKGFAFCYNYLTEGEYQCAWDVDPGEFGGPPKEPGPGVVPHPPSLPF